MTRKHCLLPPGWPLLACLLLAGMAPGLRAAPIYDVEIIVFRHKLVTDAGEQWPAPVQQGSLAGGMLGSGFIELDRSHYQLDGVRSGLRNSRDYEVLLHRAWRQVGYSTAHAIPYPVNAYSENGGYRLEGTVKLVRERYLHLDVDLVLQKAGANPPGSYTDAQPETAAYQLREKRRMRSRELHYLDHPRFGVIAIVTPYDAPEDEPEPEENVGEDSEAEAAADPVYPPDDDQLTR